MFLYVQPSNLVAPIGAGGLTAGQIIRGIPGRGTYALAGGTPPGGVAQIAGCDNLVADSPPTLLEQYEFYAYNIGAVLNVATSLTLTNPELYIEMQFLVNGEPRFVTDSGWQTPQLTAGVENRYLLNWAFSSDLINDIDITARDRLSLQAGIGCNGALASGDSLVLNVGIQAIIESGTTTAIAYPSALSYNTRALPPSRKI